jgi:hypothetical protein
MHLTDGRSSRLSSARSSRFPKWVACITATSDGRRSPTPVFPATAQRHLSTCPLFLLAHPPCPPRTRPTGQGRQPEDVETTGRIPVSSVSNLPDERVGVHRAGHGFGEGQAARARGSGAGGSRDRESGGAGNGCSVNWAFVPSMLLTPKLRRHHWPLTFAKKLSVAAVSK